MANDHDLPLNLYLTSPIEIPPGNVLCDYTRGLIDITPTLSSEEARAIISITELKEAFKRDYEQWVQQMNRKEDE